MKWYTKAIIALIVVLFVGGILGMVYLLNARMSSIEYAFQVDAVLNAAAMANEEEIHTDADKAVISEYEGKRTVIIPDNYAALSSYLRKDAMRPLYARVDHQKALHLTVCTFAELFIQPANASGDRVTIEMTAGDQRFIMSARGGNLWPSLQSCCMKGTYRGENIILSADD